MNAMNTDWKWLHNLVNVQVFGQQKRFFSLIFIVILIGMKMYQICKWNNVENYKKVQIPQFV